MIYNLSETLERNQFIEKANYYVKQGKRIELKVKHPRRSIAQNSYLHLILTWFGLEVGLTMAEVKLDIFKKHVNPTLFYDGEAQNKVPGVRVERWRSTASLDTAETTLAIDRFRNFAVTECGIYLPEPTDLVAIQQLENEISKQVNQEFI